MKLRVHFPDGSQREIDGGGQPADGACLLLEDGAWVVTNSKFADESGPAAEWTVDIDVEIAEPVRCFWRPMSSRECHLIYEYSDGSERHRARVYRTAEGPYAITGVEGHFDSERLAKEEAERICAAEDAARTG